MAEEEVEEGGGNENGNGETKSGGGKETYHNNCRCRSFTGHRHCRIFADVW